MKVEISVPGGPVGTTVRIDGVEVPNLVNVEFGHRVGEMAWVKLSFLPDILTVDANVPAWRLTITKDSQRAG